MKKLTIQLVPDSCWCSNLRSILTRREWDIVRHECYDRAQHRCVYCGRRVKRLEAHEVWSYVESTRTQRLEDIVALCHSCHSVVHIGRTSLVGDVAEAERWYMRVNGCTYAEYKRDLAEATSTHLRLNEVDEWRLDISYFVDIISRAISDGRLDGSRFIKG